ncbi:MAG: dephospho-CoA kinase [Gemmatimonadales bacterium]
MPPFRHIALTGNIAAGKTSVAALFRDWGATVIDADHLVREVQAPGSPVLAAIVRRFGDGTLLPDGSLDRPRLRSIIVTDADARHDLEALVHPAVQARRLALVDAARSRGDAIVVSDIPLLFEVLDPSAFDAVVLVDAPEPVRLARLVARGLSEAEARGMIAAQQASATKRAWRGGHPPRGPFVIDNDEDRVTLRGRARLVWDAVIA